MADSDATPIYSVVIDPEYCPQCGTRVETGEFHADTRHRCPECEMVFARNPVAATHVIVRDGDAVLLLDEPIPQHEGVWSLPGGFANYDEGPREAGVRELEEETGLQVAPSALEPLTVYHAQTSAMAFHFSTYVVDVDATTGELRPEGEGFEVGFRPVEAVLETPDRLRENDRERLALAFDV